MLIVGVIRHTAWIRGEFPPCCPPARTIGAEMRMILWSSQCREAAATTTRDGKMGRLPRVAHVWPTPPDEGFR